MLFGLDENEQVAYRRISQVSSAKLTDDQRNTIALLEQKSDQAFHVGFSERQQCISQRLSELPQIDEKVVETVLEQSGPIAIPHSPDLETIQSLLITVDQHKTRVVAIVNDLTRVHSVLEKQVAALEAFVIASTSVTPEWKAKGLARSMCEKEFSYLGEVNGLLSSVKVVMWALKDQYEVLSRIITTNQLELQMSEIPPSARSLGGHGQVAQIGGEEGMKDLKRILRGEE